MTLRKRSTHRWRIAKLLPTARQRRRAWRAFKRSQPALQALIALTLAVVLWFAANGVYQVVRKPSELFFPLSGTLNKTPAETWREYAPLFQKYSTPTITPELLAALAQVEGSGNPIIRTYWRWSFNPKPFDVYRPASSSVGMYQMTDGTFSEARHYCIRDHGVVQDGAWNDWHSCWFNGLYTRVIPAHAVELTAAYLDRSVNDALQRHHVNAALPERKLELAAMIHLCGAGAGDAYVRRGLKFTPGEHCGDQDAHAYVARVNGMRRVFSALQ